MARRDGEWFVGPGGTYIQAAGNPLGYDLLINGQNHYINFNTVTGVNGYGIRDNNGIIEYKNSGGAWTAISGGGGGAVSSVSNSDGSLTISPTTGAVVASLNVGHANTFTASQTFNATTLMGAELDISYAYPAFKVKNTSTAQYSGAGFFLTNTASTMGNEAGVTFYAGINDVSATKGYFAIDKTNTTGGGTGHLMLFDLDLNTTTFYNPLLPSAGYTYDLGTASLPWNNIWAGFSLNVQKSGINTQIIAGANVSNQVLTLPVGTGTLALTSQLTGGTVTSVATDSTLTGGPITTSGTLGINLANSNTFTAMQGVNLTNLQTTATDGFLLENTTPSTSGVPLQISPALHFNSSAWQTTVPASQSVDFRQYVLPVTASSVSGSLITQASLNGGAYTTLMSLNSVGALNITSNLTINGSFQTSGTSTNSNLWVSGNATATSVSSAQYQFASSTAVNVRSAFYGSTATVIGAGNNYAGVIFANAPIATPATGTNNSLANVVIKPIGTVTSGGATLPNTFSAYIDGASTAGVSNYALGIGGSANVVWYNTTDQVTNYELATVGWASNVFTIKTANGGTGTARNLSIGTPNRTFTIVDGASSSGFYQWNSGSGTANAVGSNFAGTWNASSGVNPIVAISPTITQTGTAGYTALQINVTESTVGSGTKLGINVIVGGSSKFSVSDTGAVVIAAGAATAGTAPLTLTAGTNNTTAAAGAIEFDGTVFTATSVASSRQVISAEQFISLTSAYTLISQTAAQALFNSTTNGAVTVLGSTTYQFECYFSLTNLSATSGSFGFGFGGTATISSQAWTTMGIKNALSSPLSTSSSYNTAANTSIVVASGNTTGYAIIKGLIRISTGGTIIPQVSLTVASAAIVGTNAYLRMWPIGSNTVTSVGNWS